jgi:RNA polymerase sigma factor for flagellar operon FliA
MSDVPHRESKGPATTADRDARILSLAPLVRKLARRVSARVASTVVDADDLEAAGWMAAIQVVERFDPSFGVPLEGYAGRVLLGAMYNELRRADPVSERDRRTIRKGERGRHELRHELGGEPSLPEVVARCPGLWRALARAERRQLSYDAALGDGGQGRLRPLGVMAAHEDVPGALIAHEAKTELAAALASLDARRRRVIAEHYFEGRSLQSVAIELEVSPQRISQLHRSALDTLQTRLAVVA